MVQQNSVGSTEMQIILLTSKIKRVSDHLINNPKDLHSRKGLVMMSNKRKTMLRYLKNNNLFGYSAITKELNIKGV